MEQSTDFGERVIRIIRRIRSIALDLTMPIHCVGCGIERTHCCSVCTRRLMALQMPPRCFCCGVPMVPASSCPLCRRSREIPRQLAWIGPYAHPLLQQAIRELKFGLRRDIGTILGSILASRCASVEPFTVVPIPLSRRRMLERGFNQSTVIAGAIAAVHGWSVSETLLERVRETQPQATLEHEQRQGNILGAFQILTGGEIPQRVLLVDDVWTTGSTMEEATRVLREAGVKEVYGVVAALG